MTAKTTEGRRMTKEVTMQTNPTPECDFEDEAHNPDLHNQIERTHSWHLSRSTSPEDWDRYWVEVAVRCAAAHGGGAA